MLGIGWGLVLLYAYPGEMVFDSYDHLMEARAGRYTDSHPPAINLIFKITRAWWNTITSFPGAYARHRLAVTSEELGFGARLTAVMPRDSHADRGKEMGLSTGGSRLQHQMSKWMRVLGRWTPIFVPYVYAIVALLLLPLALRRRDTLAILLSGLAMEGTLVFLVQGADDRYSHWLVICTVVTALLVGVRRYRGATATSLPPP